MKTYLIFYIYSEFLVGQFYHVIRLDVRKNPFWSSIVVLNWLIVFAETLIAPVRKSGLVWLDIFTASFLNEHSLEWIQVKIHWTWTVKSVPSHKSSTAAASEAEAYCRTQIHTLTLYYSAQKIMHFKRVHWYFSDIAHLICQYQSKLFTTIKKGN